jgi:hypothetical protein
VNFAAAPRRRFRCSRGAGALPTLLHAHPFAVVLFAVVRTNLIGFGIVIPLLRFYGMYFGARAQTRR